MRCTTCNNSSSSIRKLMGNRKLCTDCYKQDLKSKDLSCIENQEYLLEFYKELKKYSITNSSKKKEDFNIGIVKCIKCKIDFPIDEIGYYKNGRQNPNCYDCRSTFWKNN